MNEYKVTYTSNERKAETRFKAASADSAANLFARVHPDGSFTVVGNDEYKVFLAAGGSIGQVLDAS